MARDPNNYGWKGGLGLAAMCFGFAVFGALVWQLGGPTAPALTYASMGFVFVVSTGLLVLVDKVRYRRRKGSVAAQIPVGRATTMSSVIQRDRSRDRKSQIVAIILLVAGLIACALWPQSVAWMFLAFPLYALSSGILHAKHDVPRLEIYPDRLVIKELGNEVTVLRRDVAVFAVLEMKGGEALVAFGDPPPFRVSPGDLRSSDTVLPPGLALSLPELQDLLMKWLAADSRS